VTPESIAHYRISAKLGEGAMGEVYRATDSKLGREVAIKLIPEDFARDSSRMARFTREAQVLASLNHPNIAAIYGVEDHTLIMELVEGQTLSERIKTGPMPLDEALEVARQIADGLEAAHNKGIVHRDLKPANIKITPTGTVKLLDFGLAKADGPWTSATPVEDAPTLTVASTGTGVILGTAAYMAPEQARGRHVDKRADLWAFGVILYEMLTGEQMFHGDTVTDVLASVVRQDPDLARVPDRVRPLLERCLAKDPRKRLRDAGDAMLLLDAAPAVTVAAKTSRAPLLALGAAAALLAVALTWVSVIHWRESAPAAETARFLIPYPAGTSPISSALFAISPNGRYVAFGAFGADGVPRIWLRPIDQVTAQPLPGAEINRASLALFWSPDSGSLAYWSDQKLRRIDIAGGSPQTIADVTGNVLGGSWNRDGVIIFGSGGGLMQVPASGGTPVAVTKTDGSHLLPHFLPDGRHFLYLRSGDPGSRGVYVGSLDAKPEEQSATQVLKTDQGASYVPGSDPEDGQLLFLRDGTLFAQRFDAGRLQLSGEPTTVAEQVAVGDGLGYFAAATESGTLVYFKAISGNIRLTWFNRDGQEVGTPVESSRVFTIKLSPDGARAAIVRSDEGNNQDIWQADLVRGLTTRFTFDAGSDAQPVWSSDGSRIAWQSNRGGFGLYWKLSDGSGSDELLYKFSTGSPGLTDWTRDGRYLIYAYASDIWALPIAEGTPESQKPVLVVQADRNQLGPYVSPDQRWVAYMSNESGRQDLYVQPFAPASSRTGRPSPVAGKWMLSNGTLGMARWRDDGRELLFLGADGGVMAVDIAPGQVFKASAPRLLFQLPRVVLTMSQNPGQIVDVTRDHQRFLIAMPVVDSDSGLNVVMNWQAGLRK
jgi:Tol biopolymer transport system component/predicted Ser/Thr protein kinase